MTTDDELRRLQQRAERLARRLQRTMDEIEQVRVQTLPPEQRRRRLRVIGGAAVVAGAFGWAWARLARPEVALAVVASWGLGTVVAYDGPPEPPEPPAAVAPPVPAPAPTTADPTPTPVPVPALTPTPAVPPEIDGGNGGEATASPSATQTELSPELVTPVPTTALPVTPEPTLTPEPILTPEPERPPEGGDPDGLCLAVPLLDLAVCLLV